MSFLRFSFLIVAILMTSAPRPANAQTDGAFARLQLELADLSTLPIDEALARVDTALAGAGLADPRITFDLGMAKAELLVEAGRIEEAARFYAQLGALAARERQVLEEDPVALYDTAATLFVQAGNPAAALEMVQGILDEQRDSGRSGDILSATFARLADLARLAGDEAAAESYAASADFAAAAPASGFGSTRGEGDGGFHEVEVFYATDRARGDESQPSTFYSGMRGDALELGIAMVSIPPDHTPALVEAPSIWRLEFGPNPAKHVVLHSVVPVEPGDFYDTMRTRLEDRAADDLFVFVHGFNVPFAKAARRTAQMAHDMNFPGVPVLYSWPSRGSAFAYAADEASVRVSARRLTHFLDELVARSGAGTIHIVAHSMGNRALTDALELMALRNDIEQGDDPVFSQVVFAAPDVDAGLFSGMLPTIRPVAERLTLYASDRDFALATSRRLHGSAPRAGQAGDLLLADPNLDSVDMSDLGDDMLAHTYFASDSSALADLVTLFWRNADPSQRCGLAPRAAQAGTLTLWHYQAGACDDTTLVEIMTHLQKARVTSLDAAEKILTQTVRDPLLLDSLTPVLERLMAH